jgi:hypothetical protein
MIIPGYLQYVREISRQLIKQGGGTLTSGIQQWQLQKLLAVEIIQKPNIQTTKSSNLRCDEGNQSSSSTPQEIQYLIQALSILKVNGRLGIALRLFNRGFETLGEKSKQLVLDELKRTSQLDIIADFENLWTCLELLKK